MNNIIKYKETFVKAAPLAVFRILFGAIMALSMIRFWYHGWIEKLYLDPKFHFHYTGFEFITVPGNFTYIIFIICFLSSVGIALGLKYRISTVVFFLSFTFIELMDKATYLNHYYFISILGLLLMVLPAHVYFSIDARRQNDLASEFIPKWNIDVLKVMLAIVYIYAGLAKLNTDWMLRAMPLTLWLPTKFDIPLLGELMHKKWLHYAFSWMGALYDLTIVFFLMWKPSRLMAFVAVVVFHILTRILFPIGMFPYIMIAATLIFFSADFHDNLIEKLARFLNISKSYYDNGIKFIAPHASLKFNVVICFLVIQLFLPLRFLAYPGNVFWTEQGYRFSWRVMLMEKSGSANFKIVDGKTKTFFYVQNDDFLTSFQEKQMATQQDFIIEYGQYLGNHFSEQGHQNVEVYVESHVALNGRISQLYFDPKQDIMKIKPSIFTKSFVLPFND